MGVSGFTPFIQKTWCTPSSNVRLTTELLITSGFSPEVIKALPDRLRQLTGKTLAIDGTLITQRFHFAAVPHPYRHVLGWFRLAKELNDHGVRAICIFDGKERSLAKQGETERRRNLKQLNTTRASIEAERLLRLRKLHTLFSAARATQTAASAATSNAELTASIEAFETDAPGVATLADKSTVPVDQFALSTATMASADACNPNVNASQALDVVAVPLLSYRPVPYLRVLRGMQTLKSTAAVELSRLQEVPLVCDEPDAPVAEAPALAEDLSSIPESCSTGEIEPYNKAGFADRTTAVNELKVTTEASTAEDVTSVRVTGRAGSLAEKPSIVEESPITGVITPIRWLSIVEGLLAEGPSMDGQSVSMQCSHLKKHTIVSAAEKQPLEDFTAAKSPSTSTPVNDMESVGRVAELNSKDSSRPVGQRDTAPTVSAKPPAQRLAAPIPETTLEPKLSPTSTSSPSLTVSDSSVQQHVFAADSADARLAASDPMTAAFQDHITVTEGRELRTLGLPLDNSVMAGVPLEDAIHATKELLVNLAALYADYQRSIPKVKSVAFPTAVSSAMPIGSSAEAEEERIEHTMSRTQAALTIAEGKIWAEINRFGTFSEIDVLHAGLQKGVADLESKSGTMSASLERRVNAPNTQTYEECKEILMAMGTPCIESTGAYEAEALASSLVVHGHADYVASEDTDVLIYEAPLLRNISNRKGPLSVVSGADVRTTLQLDRASFVDFALLLGTDFSQRIKNVGPARAYKFIRQHGSIESVIANEPAYKPRMPAPAYLSQVRLARSVFDTLPPVPDLALLRPNAPDDERVAAVLEKYGVQTDEYDWEGGAALGTNYFGDNPSVSETDFSFTPFT